MWVMRKSVKSRIRAKLSGKKDGSMKVAFIGIGKLHKERHVKLEMSIIHLNGDVR